PLASASSTGLEAAAAAALRSAEALAARAPALTVECGRPSLADALESARRPRPLTCASSELAAAASELPGLRGPARPHLASSAPKLATPLRRTAAESLT